MQRIAIATQDGGAGAGAQHGGAGRGPTSFCLAVGPPVGGTFQFKFSSRPDPRKFGAKRFLVVSEVAGEVSGVACFGLPPWKKFSAERRRLRRRKGG